MRRGGGRGAGSLSEKSVFLEFWRGRLVSGRWHSLSTPSFARFACLFVPITLSRLVSKCRRIVTENDNSQ